MVHASHASTTCVAWFRPALVLQVAHVLFGALLARFMLLLFLPLCLLLFIHNVLDRLFGDLFVFLLDFLLVFLSFVLFGDILVSFLLLDLLDRILGDLLVFLGYLLVFTLDFLFVFLIVFLFIVLLTIGRHIRDCVGL